MGYLEPNMPNLVKNSVKSYSTDRILITSPLIKRALKLQSENSRFCYSETRITPILWQKKKRLLWWREWFDISFLKNIILRRLCLHAGHSVVLIVVGR